MGTLGETLPDDLVLELLELLPLPELISAYHVDHRWRSLVPRINSPLRLRFFKLAFHDASGHPNNYPVSLATGQTFVNHVEDRVGCTLPDDFRFVLTEWPVRCPPPGYHWPHSVRFFADGYCTCHRTDPPGYSICSCEDDMTRAKRLVMVRSLRDEVRHKRYAFVCGPRGQPDSRSELFFNTPRLYLPEHATQTIRFILAHDDEYWDKSSERWTGFTLKTLRLSPYYVADDGAIRGGGGDFHLILEGPCRGQIHAWFAPTWYDGFEAESFLDWKYEEMSNMGFFVRAPPLPSPSPAELPLPEYVE